MFFDLSESEAGESSAFEFEWNGDVSEESNDDKKNGKDQRLQKKQEKKCKKKKKFEIKEKHNKKIWDSQTFDGYTTTQGQTDKTGIDYEIKMAALLYLRAVKMGYKFYLATGVEAAGKFDDIVFEYNDGTKVRTALIQLKHKLTKKVKCSDLLTSDKGDCDFSLIKYYKSFCDIRNNYIRKTGMKWNGNFDDFSFVLCTNAAVDTTDKTFKHVANWEQKNIIDTGGKAILFDKCENIKTELVNRYKTEVDLSQIDEFLNKTILFANQAARNQLDEYIKQEITDYYKVSPVGANEIFEEYVPYIEKWWEGSADARKSLNENSYIVPNALSVLATLNKTKKDQFDKISAEFNKQVLENLHDSLSRKESIVNVVAKNTSTNLCSLKVYESFRHVSKNTVIVSSAMLQDNEYMRKVQYVWPSKECLVLIVDKDSNEKDTEGVEMNDIYNSLFSKLTNSEYKIIIVSRQEESFPKASSAISSIKLSVKLMELTLESVNKVMNTVVSFQGINQPIKTALGENCTDIIDSVFLSKLLAHDQVTEIGKPLTSLESYHQNRYLEHHIYVKTSVLCGNLSDSFAVTGVLENKLPDLIQEFERLNNTRKMQNKKLSDKIYHGVTKKVPGFKNVIRRLIRGGFSCSSPKEEEPKPVKEHTIYAVESFEQFENLCKHHDSIHWLEVKDRTIKWKHSKGDMSVIQSNLDSESDMYDVKTVYDIPDNIVLLTSEPGMGKSTLVSQVAYNTKLYCPDMFVIKINLNECTTFLADLDLKNISNADVDNFLLISEDKMMKNEYEEKVMKHVLKHPERVVLLIDSFDEIMPLYDDHVLAMLQKITEMKFSKLWLASRSVLNSVLEQALGTLSFSIKPLDSNEQTKLLMEYWKYKGIDADVEQLQSFTEKVLGTVDNKTFLGIPLHCQMVGETCGEYLEKFIATKELLVIPKFNFLKLCEDFVNKKFDIYCTKNNIDINATNTELRRMIALRKKSFENDHMYCSLLVILKSKEVDLGQVERDVKEFIDSISQGGEKTGIINSIRRDGTPQFVHKVFAEYFVAQYLAKNLQLYEKILKTTPAHEKGARFGVVINFMDEILSKDLPLHKAVLLSDVDEIKLQFDEKLDDNAVNAVDALGRTALHIATEMLEQYVNRRDPTLLARNLKIIELLTKHGANINIEDKILNRTPFGHVLSISEFQWNALSVMYEAGNVTQIDMRKLGESIKKLGNCNYTKLLDIIENGYTKFITFLTQTVENPTSLQTALFNEAAKEGKLICLKYFVESKQMNSSLKEKLMLKALCTASSKGYLDIVKYLVIDCQVNPYCITDYSKSAIGCAVSQGHVNVFEFFVETQEEKVDGNFEAKDNCSLECLKYVIKACHHSDAIDTYKNVSLVSHMISCQYHVNIIDYFIKTCNININVHDSDHNSLLHFACMYLNTAVLRLLIDKYGINPDIKNTTGITPFLMSAEKNFSAAVHYLYEKCQVNTSIQDIHGNTALHYSVSGKVPDKRVVSYLIEKCKIDPKIKNKNGETAYDISVKRFSANDVDFDISVVKYLRDSNQTLNNQIPAKVTDKSPSERSEKPFSFGKCDEDISRGRPTGKKKTSLSDTFEILNDTAPSSFIVKYKRNMFSYMSSVDSGTCSTEEDYKEIVECQNSPHSLSSMEHTQLYPDEVYKVTDNIIDSHFQDNIKYHNVTSIKKGNLHSLHNMDSVLSNDDEERKCFLPNPSSVDSGVDLSDEEPKSNQI